MVRRWFRKAVSGLKSLARKVKRLLKGHQKQMRENEAYRTAFMTGATALIRKFAGNFALLLDTALLMYGAV